MTREQNHLLAVHAEHFRAMASCVRESSDDALAQLLDACLAANISNCGWGTYAAAKYLEIEIKYELGMRALRARLMQASDAGKSGEQP